MTYKYDIFLSYRNHGRWRDWIELHFLPNLEHYLGEDLGHSMVDPQTSQLWSRQYFGSTSCRKELAYMLAKEKHY